MTEQQFFYVGISSPEDIRRELLQSSKLLINLMRRTEVFNEIKQLKLAYSTELNKTMDELQSIQRKLRSKMPRLPTQPSVEVVHEREQTTEKEEHIKSQIEQLEDELARIEERLRE